MREHRIKQITKAITYDTRISIALMSSFVVLTLQYFILLFFNLSDTKNGSIVQLISKGIVGVLFIYAIPIVLKKNKITFLLTYFIAIFIFLLNFFLFPENNFYLSKLIFPFFFTCLPAFLYSISIDNLFVFKEIMKKSSVIIFIIGTLIGLMVFTGNVSIGYYSMTLSYYLLFPLIMFLDEFFEKTSFKSITVILVSASIILALGSRGPILCAIIFVIMKMVKEFTKLNKRTIILYVILLDIAILVLLFLKKILLYLYNLLLTFGINSRSLLLFLGENINLSGRDAIYKNVWAETMKNPYLGIGLGGDRRVNGEIALYAHNFFIEIFADFGIFIGSIISIVLMLVILKSLIGNNKEQNNMCAIWLSLGFVHLMVSGSYIIDMKFWIFLGILFRNIMCKTKHQNTITVIRENIGNEI